MTETYQITLKPAFSNILISTVSARYQAPDFLWYLDGFMETHSITPTTTLNKELRITAYKHFSLELPFVRKAASERQKDVVHATCSIPASTTSKGYRAATPAKISTVLVCVSERSALKGPLDGKIDECSAEDTHLITNRFTCCSCVTHLLVPSSTQLLSTPTRLCELVQTLP